MNIWEYYFNISGTPRFAQRICNFTEYHQSCTRTCVCYEGWIIKINRLNRVVQTSTVAGLVVLKIGLQLNGLFDFDSLMFCIQKIKYRSPLATKHILQEIALPQFQRILIVNSKFLGLDGRNKLFYVSRLFDFFLILKFGLIFFFICV